MGNENPQPQPEGKPNIAKLVREARAELQREKNASQQLEKVSSLLTSGKATITRVSDLRIEAVTDPALGTELESRHRVLNRSQDIVTEVRRTNGNLDQMSELVDFLRKHGAMLQNEGYGAVDLAGRIADSRWKVLRALGSIFDVRRMQPRDCESLGDIQIQSAEARSDAPLITAVPHPDRDYSAFHDDKKNRSRAMAKMILDNPASLACIEDVEVAGVPLQGSVQPSLSPEEYHRKGIGGALLNEGLQLLRRENAKRPSKEIIRVVVAKMFSIHSVDGIVLPPDVVRNQASLFTHMVGVRTDLAESMWAWKDVEPTNIKVHLPNDPEIHVITAFWEAIALYLVNPVDHSAPGVS